MCSVLVKFLIVYIAIKCFWLPWLRHVTNSLEFGILMYLDRLHNWGDFAYGLFIFLILAELWLVKIKQRIEKNAYGKQFVPIYR